MQMLRIGISVILLTSFQLNVRVDGTLSQMCIPANTTIVTVPLSGCNKTSMIHVKQEIIGSASNTCTVEQQNICLHVRETSKETIPNCNGMLTCRESVTVNAEKCISPKFAAAVDFECILGSLDICSPNSNVEEGPIYLHSPRFPESTNVTGNCSCNITGSQMRVELLELYSTRVLNVSAGGVKVWPVPRELPVQYNRELVGPGATVNMTDAVDVTYRTRNTTSKQNMWLKISGTGGLKVECSGDMSPSSPVPPSTGQPTTSPTTTTTTTTTTSTTAATTTAAAAASAVPTTTIILETIDGNPQIQMIVGIAAGVGLLLIIVVIIIVSCRSKRNQESVEVGKPLTDTQNVIPESNNGIVNHANLYVNMVNPQEEAAPKREAEDNVGTDVNTDEDVYNIAVHSTLRNPAPCDLEQTYNQTYAYIPAANIRSTSKESEIPIQTDDETMNEDETNGTYSTIATPSMHVRESEPSSDLLESEPSSDTTTTTQPANSVSAVSTSIHDVTQPKSTAKVMADVSAVYSVVVRPNKITDGDEETPNNVQTEDGKPETEDPDLDYVPPVPDKHFNEDDTVCAEGIQGNDETQGSPDNELQTREKIVTVEKEDFRSGEPQQQDRDPASSGMTDSTKEEPETIENDLYHTFEPTIQSDYECDIASVSVLKTEKPEMIDNDLYHSYKGLKEVRKS